jgi:hypothetical protein
MRRPSPQSACSVQVVPELAALAVDCPLTGTNPPNCPLHGVRQKSRAEALAWLGKLSPDEQAFLLQYHQCCLAVTAGALGEPETGWT